MHVFTIWSSFLFLRGPFFTIFVQTKWVCCHSLLQPWFMTSAIWSKKEVTTRHFFWPVTALSTSLAQPNILESARRENSLVTSFSSQGIIFQNSFRVSLFFPGSCGSNQGHIAVDQGYDKCLLFLDKATFHQTEQKCKDLGMRMYQPQVFSEWQKLEPYSKNDYENKET